MVAKATKATENREEKVWPIDGGYWMVGCWMCSSGRVSPPPPEGKKCTVSFCPAGGIPHWGRFPPEGRKCTRSFYPTEGIPPQGGYAPKGEREFHYLRFPFDLCSTGIVACQYSFKVLS